ncbi:MAG: DUF3791 domain-containing protein [Bacteroidales bacterium]|nr:DUF3791 domain-containing protein [Bacteroidales bacterium]
MLPDVLLSDKIANIILILANKLNISVENAMDIFYKSNTCNNLYNSSTMLYTFGDLYIVDDVLNEIKAR